MSHTRSTALIVLACSLFCVAPSLTAAEPATKPAEQGGMRSLKGRIVALDAASGDMKLAWKHRGMNEMEINIKVDPAAQVVVDGKPAKLTDLKAGDSVAISGEPRGIGSDNRFVASRVETARLNAASTGPAPANIDPKVNDILDRLERKKITDIETPIRFTKTDPVLEDKQVFEGILRFKEDKPNPRFFIRFDKFTQEGVTREKKEWHVFDGQWYIEARENTKTIVKRQIVRPGEEVNVFRIGQGPFPLPFGQSKAEILKYFDCKLVPPQPKDPANAVHLECVPKPDTDMAKKYGSVHFYINQQLDLPVTVRTVEKTENVEVSAEFPADQIKTNTGMAASQLNLPDLGGYQVDTVPLPASEPSGQPK